MSVGYEYDAANRLQTVTDNRLANATTYAYDDAGNLLSFTYPNGVVHTFTYDVTDRPTNLAVTKGGVTQASYAQTFSDAGRKLTVNENGTRLVNYAYDDIYRLLSETIGADSLVYTLDPVGNRLNRASTIPSLPTVGSTYDNNDRLTADSYDANGNTLASGGNSYGYDFEDRLTSFNGGSVTMVYDGDGNRVVRTEGGVTTRYLVDELTPTGYAQVAEEVVAEGVARRYVHGVQRTSQTQLISSVWTTHYYGYDGGFSVRQLNDGAGAVTDTYTYDAFGNMIGSTGTTPNVFLYRGEQWDESLHMYYLRARYYIVKTGRFLTVDKYEENGIASCDCAHRNIVQPSSNALHLFSYTGHNPVNRLDPSGRRFLERALALNMLEGLESASAGRQLYQAAKYVAVIICREISILNAAAVVGVGKGVTNNTTSVFCAFVTVWSWTWAVSTAEDVNQYCEFYLITRIAMTRSTYWIIAVTFIGFTGSIVLAVKDCSSSPFRGVLKTELENMVFLVAAIGILAGWLRATFFRIRNIGAPRTWAFFLCLAVLACWSRVTLFWISSNNRLAACVMLAILHLPLMVIRGSSFKE